MRHGSSRWSWIPPLTFGLLAGNIGFAVENQKRQFTVQDSIAWTSVLNFAGDYRSNPLSGTALFSPAGQLFVIHTRKGDLERNLTRETLQIFETRAVVEFLHGASAVRPNPCKSFVINLTRDSGSLSHIQWLDEERLAFIAEGKDGGVNQLHVANLGDGTLEQITHSLTPVVSFAASRAVFLFYARQPVGPPPVGDAVGNRAFSEMLYAGEPDSTPLELFQMSALNRVVTRINLVPAQLIDVFQGIWISPSGRRAIVLVPANDVPSHWTEYRVPNQEMFGYSSQSIAATVPRSGEEGSSDWLHSRYALIDLEHNKVTNLLDAPSGWLAQNGTPISAFWFDPTERRVLVTNTFMPLLDASGSAKEQRRVSPAIAEIDLKSNQARVVLWEPSHVDEAAPPPSEVSGSIESVSWDEKASTLKVIGRSASSGTKLRDTKFLTIRRDGETWKTRSRRVDDAASRLTIRLRQGLNQPPRIFASASGRDRELLDPNPGAGSFEFGRTEVFTWRDPRHGVTWTAGLLHPPGYIRGRRYPLIVQTHGFDENQFLLDGPGSGGTTAMAAQAFANAGFLILQVEDKPYSLDEAEGILFADGFQSGIQALIDQGLADAQRVGLIAFSRTGFHALHFLARYPHLLKAIDISDSVQIGYMAHVLLTNTPMSGRRQLESMSGGAPSRDIIGDWFARNPTYELPETSTAVRLEANNSAALLGMWETYAVLRNAGRAVDFIYFPQGAHVQTRPAERLGSQGGNFDWFKFWLLGQSDPAEDKSAQYRRWTRLRDLVPDETRREYSRSDSLRPSP